MYKAKLLEHASSIGPIDPHRETKCADDVRQLQDMFEGVPRPVIEHFIDIAEYERIAIPCTDPLKNLITVVAGPSFHFHDKGLLKLIRDFATDLNAALEISSLIFYDYGRTSKIASLRDHVSYLTDPRREEFLYHIALAKQGFSLLNSYVREHFPDLDLKACDQIGMEYFNAVQAKLGKVHEEAVRKAAARTGARE